VFAGEDFRLKPFFSLTFALQLQRQLSADDLSARTTDELRDILRAREAWHALAEAQGAAALAGHDAEREVLLKQAAALQIWPSRDSPIIGMFCGDDMVPRFHENNVRFLLHTLQHTEPEWKHAIFGFFQEIFQRSWNDLLDHYKISNDDHSVKKLTRTLEKKFRAKVWWHVHREEEKRRESAAASAASVAGDASLPASCMPSFVYSNYDTVPPGVLLHTNGSTWAPTTGHWVTYDWGSRDTLCGGLRQIVVSASSLNDHSMPAIMDSFHELFCTLKQRAPIPRPPPSHTPRPLPSSSDFSSGYAENSEVFERCCACGELAPSHYVAKMAVPALGFTRKVPVCHFCERLGAAAATEF
jgi:hypothetical protein